MTWLISDEARKHRAFREVWVAYLLAGCTCCWGYTRKFRTELQRAL